MLFQIFVGEMKGHIKKSFLVRKSHFKALISTVLYRLVYGAMPDIIFSDLKDATRFVQYPDWTTRMKSK